MRKVPSLKGRILTRATGPASRTAITTPLRQTGRDGQLLLCSSESSLEVSFLVVPRCAKPGLLLFMAVRDRADEARFLPGPALEPAPGRVRRRDVRRGRRPLGHAAVALD